MSVTALSWRPDGHVSKSKNSGGVRSVRGGGAFSCGRAVVVAGVGMAVALAGTAADGGATGTDVDEAVSGLSGAGTDSRDRHSPKTAAAHANPRTTTIIATDDERMEDPLAGSAVYGASTVLQAANPQR